MDWLDILSTVAYFILAVLLGLYVRSRHVSDPIYRKYFMKGLLAKVLGGIGFALVYTFYYTYGGDTKSYFQDASKLLGILMHSPGDYLAIFFGDPDQVAIDYADELRGLRHAIGTSEWFTARITSVVTVLGLNNYFSTTILFSLLSFVGIWKFFLVMVRRYPEVHKAIAFSILFVPSVFFWGSGILKDCIVIGFLGYLMHHADVFSRKSIIYKTGSGLVIVFCSFVIYNIKAYVVISLIPALLIWVVLEFREKITSPVIRAMIVPLLLVGSLIGVVASVQFLGQFNQKYSVENVLATAEGMQKWHYGEGEDSAHEIGRGSGYSLGEYDDDVWGLLQQFLPAVNVTFFRPYLWEVKNVMMLAAAIESTIIMLFSIFIFLGLGFFRVIKLLKDDSFLLMSVIFAIFFAFAVGFSSYNFGALVRYKIPCIPFYISALFILKYKVDQLKEAKRSRVKYARARRRAQVSV